jgi:hypothetical protein
VKRGLKRILALLVAGLVALLLTAAWVWRADIHEALLDPGVPFQTYTPPPAPNYADLSGWDMLPANPADLGPGDPQVDIFFVHPTTFDGGREWNGPIGNRDANRLTRKIMLPNYAGPFRSVGRVFAPRYRQASLYTHITSRDDAREARAFAYRDVAAAFDLYLRTYNRGRPFIIVGVEQGGFLAERLLIDLDPLTRQRLVAAYLIEAAVPKDSPPLAPCTQRKQAHCLVAWVSRVEGEADTLAERLRHSLIWSGDHAQLFGSRRPVCVDPVSGVAGGGASAKEHLGGVNASDLDWDARPAFLAHQVSTACREDILQVSRPRAPSLRPTGKWVEQQRARPFNLFYADLEADAQARLAAMQEEPTADDPTQPAS